MVPTILGPQGTPPIIAPGSSLGKYGFHSDGILKDLHFLKYE